jgi:calcineurin-like phosphoesterase family protein
MDFFISDNHFGHKNIIKYMNRPFSSSEEMNLEMIKSWNSVVGCDDRVFLVGDAFLCNEDDAADIVSQLNGYKILIAGNHDRSKKTMIGMGFDEYHRELSYSFGDIGTALLKHYPLPDRVIKEKGYDFLVHGHLHKPPHIQGLKVNVAADIINFIPVTSEYLKEIFNNSSSNEESEILDFKIKDDNIFLNLKIRIEDFSGSVDHIYSILRKHWEEEEK